MIFPDFSRNPHLEFIETFLQPHCHPWLRLFRDGLSPQGVWVVDSVWLDLEAAS